MNQLQKINRWILGRSFKLSVSLIQLFSSQATKQQHSAQVAAWKQLPLGSLGRSLVECLEQHELDLVPGFESHDLKHLVLDYPMTAEDEIRLQAFMLGNGNYTLPCFAILGFGMLFLPECWGTFYKDFQRGRTTASIVDWKLENYVDKDLQTLQMALHKSQSEERYYQAPLLPIIAQFGAFSAIFAGVLGMFICLPFLFSSNIADLIGAGFPFIGGAILAVGGLLALSNMARPLSLNTHIKGMD